MKVKDLLDMIPYIRINENDDLANVIAERLKDGTKYYGMLPFSKIKNRVEDIFPMLMSSETFAILIKNEWFKGDQEIKKDEFVKNFNKKTEKEINDVNLLFIIYFVLAYFDAFKRSPNPEAKDPSFLAIISKLIAQEEETIKRKGTGNLKIWVYRKIEVAQLSEDMEERIQAIRDIGHSPFEKSSGFQGLGMNQSLVDAYNSQAKEDLFTRMVTEMLAPKASLPNKKEILSLIKKAEKGDTEAFQQLSLLDFSKKTGV